MVLVDGEVIFKDGSFTRIDHKAILTQIAEVFAKPRSDSEAKRRWLRHEIFPEVEKFYAGYLTAEPERVPFYKAGSRT